MKQIELSRRHALQCIGGGLLAATMLAPASAASGYRPIGIQLYPLAELLKADLTATLRRLRRIGYQTVELGDAYGLTAPQLRAELDRAGLQCASVHLLPSSSLSPGVPSLADIPRAAAFVRGMGADMVVCPTIPFSAPSQLTVGSPVFLDYLLREARSKSQSDWQRMAYQFNRWGEGFAAEGLRFGFHNHNIELGQLPGGRLPLDILIRETDPALVSFELDIGWVMAAGLDPVRLLKDGKGRISQIHLKDIAPTRPNNSLQLKTADIGKGIGNWKAIFAELRDQPGIANVYIEREPPFDRSAFATVRDAYNFVRHYWH